MEAQKQNNNNEYIDLDIDEFNPVVGDVADTDGSDTYEVEDIVSIEQLDDFDDEYVYDVEVEDTHTFFANDILVHNSIYVEFGRVCKQCHVPLERQAQFVVDLWNYSLGPYMKQKYEEYAKRFNCPKNIQELELEKVSDVTLYTSKKHYAMSECWKEPDIFLPKGKEVVYKGLDIIKGSTASFAKEVMIAFTKNILNWYIDHETPIDYGFLINDLKKYKVQFNIRPPEEISSGASVGDYEKFVLQDTGGLMFASKVPAHIKACGIYNYILGLPQNKKYKARYSRIQTAAKIRWYYTKKTGTKMDEFEVFAFNPGEYPAEFAPQIDRDKMFEKTVLSFVNQVLTDVLHYPPVTAKLMVSDALF